MVWPNAMNPFCKLERLSRPSRLTLICGLISLLVSTPVFADSPPSKMNLDQAHMSLIQAHSLTGKPEGHDAAPDPYDPLPKLGRALFFSRNLSGEKKVACVSCHHPLLGGGDGLSLAVGVAAHQSDIVGPGRVLDIGLDGDPKAQTIGGPNVPRNTLTTFNAGFYQKGLLHDGRIFKLGVDDDGVTLFRTPDSSLRDLPDANARGDLLTVQARFPVTGFDEMRGYGEFYGLTAPEVRDAIADRFIVNAEEWLLQFQIGFQAPGVPAEELMTFENIARALSAYQRSQSFVDSPWSKYVGGDLDALTTPQKQGARLFFEAPVDGGYGCASCHSGDFFTDEQHHAAGFPQLGRGKRSDGDDPGRYLVTQDPDDRYRFRTPSLLNVSETGPWGHSGAFSSLSELVA